MSFNELDLTTDIADMSEDEAKETLSDFMEAHKKNQTAYDELQTQFSEREDELEGEIEDLQDTISEFHQERAEEAAEYVKMPAGILADRFSLPELEQIIEEGEEADFSEPEDDEDEEEPERLTTFSERPDKGKTESNKGTERYRSTARAALSAQGFPATED